MLDASAGEEIFTSCSITLLPIFTTFFLYKVLKLRLVQYGSKQTGIVFPELHTLTKWIEVTQA